MKLHSSGSLRLLPLALATVLSVPAVLTATLLTLSLAPCALAQEEGPTPLPTPTTAPQNPQTPPADAAPAAPTAAPSPASAASTGTTSAPAKLELPVGTHLPLVLHNGVSTRTAKVGDPVYFETLFPVMLNGKVIVPAGSYVSGEITETKRPGRVKGKAEIMLSLRTLILPNAYMVMFAGSPSGASTGGNETTDAEGKIIGGSDKGSDAGTIAKTTAAGAGIGGIAGAASGHPARGTGNRRSGRFGSGSHSCTVDARTRGGIAARNDA